MNLLQDHLVDGSNRLPSPTFSFLIFLLFFILYPLPSHPNSLHTYHQVSMGTVIEITLMGDDGDAANQAALRAFQEIKRIEKLMSPWEESSDVARINRAAGKEWVRVSPETFQVIKKSLQISALSGGTFDITLGPLTHLWRRVREKKVPPPVEEVRKMLPMVNYQNILVSPEKKILLKRRGMSIDLGGIAKGYAVDRAFELLRSLAYKSLIINAGGDLRAGGFNVDQPWRIGIQHPRDPHKIINKISVSESAVATSGDYEKFFIHEGKRYHHILNPRDGLPAEGCQSVTLLSHDGMTADALATAVFVLGPVKGFSLCQKLVGVDCFIVDAEGKIILSPGLKTRLLFPTP